MNYNSILITAIYENGGGITLKQIIKKYGIPKKNEEKLKNAIKDFVKKGDIYKNKKDQLYICDMKNVFTGEIAGIQRTFGFVTNTLTGEDLFVSGGALSGAVPGDTVLAKEIYGRHNGKSSTAIVLAVLKKSERLFSGVIVTEGRFLKVLPDNLGCPPLEIIKFNAPLHENDKVLFSLRKRGTHHSEHKVEIKHVIGDCKYAKNCTESYLIQNDIPTEFSTEAIKQAEKIGIDGIDSKEVSKRLDLRDIPIFTIDGADTKDIDDAISIEKKDNVYLLGVHIADVSHYVKPDSPLDKDAFERGTSIYIADKVIPMLPKELSNGVCSLNPRTDRLAFSCLMEISSEGKLLKYKFKKTVIRSRVKGVYSEINQIIDKTASDEIIAKYSEVSAQIPIMIELAEILQQSKKNRGAPEIISRESKIICNEDGICYDVKPRTQGISEGIIEEFMLMANNAAAKLAMKNELPFVYRVHENPPADKIETLKATLDCLGIDTNALNEKATAGVFAKILEKAKEDPRCEIINSLILRTMSKAKYSELPIGHFGLVMTEYAHFTSPIRRYSDLAIHRILSDYTSRKGAEKIRNNYSDFAQRAANRASATEISAVTAERECEDFYCAEYMLNHIGEEFDGRISGIINSGFFVELPNTVEGKVDISDLPIGSYEVVNGISYVEQYSNTVYTLGDAVKVKCVASNVSTGQIDFELIKIIK